MKSRRLSPQKKSLDKPKADSLQQTTFIAIGLLCLSVLIRLPFFFRDVIDWDESTFILMGQSILDGHLPYTELWDNKPPLAFVFYALIIAIFGKSIVSVRIAGAIAVAFVAFCTYLVGKTLWSKQVGILGAGIFVFIASSLIPGGQATMTEHLALLPFMGAMSLLVTKKITLRTLFVTGILMAVASLIRLNLAYVTVLVGFFVMFAIKPYSIEVIVKRGLIYAAGSCLVILSTYLPYAITGYHKIWLNSVIVAPLTYANSQLSAAEILGVYLNSNVLGIRIIISIGLVAIAFLFGQLIKSFRPKRLESELRLICFLVFFLGTGISILKGGAAYNHYLIQLAPFIALITAVFLSRFLHKPMSLLTINVIVLGAGTLAVLIIIEYYFLVSRYITTKELTFGSAYKIAAYLKQENTSREPIYLMSDHIVYWLVDAQPLTKVSAHPSNIARDYLFKAVLGADASIEGEINKILAQKPRFIIKEESVGYLDDHLQAKLILENNLNQHYELVKQIQGKQIYRRFN